MFRTNRPTALVVTGDQDVAGVASRSLRRVGFVAIQSSGAEDCIRRLRSDVPALIVVEEHLADGSGWELVRILKRLSTTARVPVLGLGDMTRLEDLARALHVGCDGFVSKPYSEEAVIAEAQVLVAGALAS